MLYEIGRESATQAGLGFSPATRSEYFLVIAGYLSLAAVAGLVAHGLLAGRDRARWVGLVIAVIGLGLSVPQLADVVLTFVRSKHLGYLALSSRWLASPWVALV